MITTTPPRLTAPMNPAVKKLWVNALRDPTRYQQCHGTLKRSGVGFCCLGVLTDLFINFFPGKVEWVPIAESNTAIVVNRLGHYSYEESSAILIKPVAEWAGLTGWNPTVPITLFPGKKSFCTLSELNDNGYSFEKIADVIEKYL